MLYTILKKALQKLIHSHRLQDYHTKLQDLPLIGAIVALDSEDRRPPSWCSLWFKLEKHSVEVASGGLMFVPSFMKLHSLFKILLGKHTGMIIRWHDSLYK